MIQGIKRSTVLRCAVLTAMVVCGGCGVPGRKPLEIRYFLMQPEFAPQEKLPSEMHCVIIRPVSAPSPYREPSLVYRTSDVEFETDYYNRFMTSPPGQLTRTIVQWSDAIGWTACPESTADSRIKHVILRPTLEALYGDFRDRAHPAAVAEMQFTLTHVDPTCQCSRVLLSKLYSERVELETSSPAALVHAQSRAVENILHRLRADLSAILP